MIQGISHLTFIVQELERAAAFFTAIFGAEEVYTSGSRVFSLAREKFLVVGGVWVCLMEGEPARGRTYDHVAFAIREQDFELYESRVLALGVEVRPSRPRVEGEGRSLYFYDWDGHLFELHTGTLAERLVRYGE